ncbi:hypothetical protein FRC19_004819 [Serendipita sp. 401]|nr:hypothetical protein FRC19_004819 [Serendipita sp. 401]
MQPSAFSYPNSTPSYYGMNSRLNTSSSSLPHPSTTSPVQNSPIQHPQRSAPYPIPGNTAPKMMEMALDASRSSHQSRPHSCDECGLSFARGHDLKRHRETHKNIRPYLCDCGKSFTRKDALKRHRYLKGCGTGGSSPGSGGGYSTGED